MKKCPRCGAEYTDTNTLCPVDGTALESSGDPLIGETLAGKYRIDERLSVGGMGAVYLATHILMDKRVAVKVLRPSLAADETIVARFSREARAASRISHPHALSVTDFGEAETGVVFLVMEYLDGRTLKEVIRDEGPLPLARVVEIMRQIGAALDAAHAEGVIHRDLKSDNIMLLKATGADYAKVLDFGIAKIQQPVGGQDPELTSPDLIIGTPQYMSPEQCSQIGDLDARSDVYSLGVILFEMLVGHVPFTGASPTAIMLKHLQEPAPSVFDERSDLPVGVGIVVAKALAKRAEDRYQSAGELVEDLVIAAGSGMIDAPVSQAAANRIVVPTQPSEELVDEQTLVRPRITAPVAGPAALPAQPEPPGFSPWRIIIPSVAGLLVVFAVIYAFTRTSTPDTNANQPGNSTLSADPNSQPVQPGSSPTGRDEQGIPIGGAVSLNSNANANATASPTPLDAANTNVNANANINANNSANVNANRAAESPSPRSTPEASPKPTNPVLPPPPPKSAPSPKPSEAPPGR
jgi:serine/threonine-protein kinase